ncbi:MAG: spore coat protein YlbD [bacterium]
MDKKEEFKEFIKSRPELIDFVKNGSMSWQKFYEIYDLYGGERGVWDKYTVSENSTEQSAPKLTDLMKGINMESIQEHIGTAQKALGFVQELASTGKTPSVSPKGPSVPRPINKFFGD